MLAVKCFVEAVFGLPVSCKTDSYFRERREWVGRADNYLEQTDRLHRVCILFRMAAFGVFCGPPKFDWMCLYVLWGLYNISWVALLIWLYILGKREQRQKCFMVQLVCQGQCLWPFQILILYLRVASSCVTKVKLQALLSWAQDLLCGLWNKILEWVCFPFLWVFALVVVFSVFSVCVWRPTVLCLKTASFLLLGIRSISSCKMLLWPSVCDWLWLRGWR